MLVDFNALTKREPNKLIAKPVSTIAPAVSFHHCIGSSRTIVALSMPVIGTNSANGAIVAVGYLRISSDQIPKPIMVFGYD